MKRRSFLAGGIALAASPAFAQKVFLDYDQAALDLVKLKAPV